MSRLEAGAADPAPVFAALGDSPRLALVNRLRDGQAWSISQLSEGLTLTRQGVTKHLRVLQQAGIVSADRVGRERQFTFVPERIEQLKAYLDSISEQWDDALNRLRAHVES